MKINFLGPFDVLHRGVRDVPTPPKLRQVLALLASCAGESVSCDRLVEEVWQEHPPASAATTMQTYVYHLRKAYQLSGPGAGGAALRTVAGGYRLEISESDVDGSMFARSWASLKATRGSAPRESVVAEIRSALALWRGEAFEGVRLGPSLTARKVLLQEQRKAMSMRRIDLELEQGRHHELLVELRDATTEHPGDEGLLERLMLALYRSGRRLEALEVYRSAREEAIESLGLEPHPALQVLHERILRGDPGLDVSTVETVSVRTDGVPSGPDTMPAGARSFVGRDTCLDRALTCFSDLTHPCIAQVTGFPGSGRTELCLQIARHTWDLFPDGHLYATLADTAPTDVVAGFLSAAGFTASQIPQGWQDRCRVLRGWLSGRRVLMVLDDVHDLDDVRELLPTRPGCAALVVCDRRSHAPSLTTHVPLGGLDEAAATNLLRGLVGEERLAAEPDAVAALVAMSGGLPGVLVDAAGTLNSHPHWSVSRLVTRLAGPLGTPGGDSTIGHGPVGPLHRSLARRVERISSTVVPVMEHLVGSGEALAASALAQRFDISVEEAEVHADELVQYDLVQVIPGPGPAYRAHPLLASPSLAPLTRSREVGARATRPA